tara:strand:- start:130 stop:615 length:486 start_codon:yes stop_codon:yes gene_type:complete
MTRARELAKLGNPNVIAVDGSNQIGVNTASPKTQLNVVGVVSATSFSGSGANLTNMDTDSLWLQNSEFSSISTTASVGIGTTRADSTAKSNNTVIFNAGIVTAYKLYGDLGSPNPILGTGVTVYATGIVSATSFYGDAANMTNAGISAGKAMGLAAFLGCP